MKALEILIALAQYLSKLELLSKTFQYMLKWVLSVFMVLLNLGPKVPISIMLLYLFLMLVKNLHLLVIGSSV